MSHYSLYGLTLRTDRPLPDLGTEVGTRDADVSIEVAGMDEVSSMPALASGPGEVPPFVAHRVDGPDGWYLRVIYAGAGHEAQFVIDRTGTRIWVRHNSLVGPEDVAALLSGPIIVGVLRLRGLTCLHASVVDVGGRAVALLGARGAGKTTTALALVGRGARLVADDVAAIGELGDGYALRPGHPRLRVRPEPAEALGQSFDALRPVWSSTEDRPRKRYVDCESPTSGPDAALPLAAVFVLGDRHAGGAVGGRPLSAPMALPILMTNRHKAGLTDRDAQSLDFARLGALARRVPIVALDRPEGAEHAVAVADAILDYVTRAA